MATSTNNKRLALGAGLAAATAAAAGYYFYASPKAKTHRKKAAKWATDMKNEVVREVKKLEKESPKAIDAVIDRVAKAYTAARSVQVGEVRKAAKELKMYWDEIQTSTRRGARPAKKTVKKPVKKSTKKGAKAS